MKLIGKANVMRVSLIVIATLFLLTLFGYIVYRVAATSSFSPSYAVNQPDNPNLESSPNSLKLTVNNLLELTNNERIKVSHSPLQLDDQLANSAQQVADDMNKHAYFSHSYPDSGKPHTDTIWDQVGNRCSYVSENIVHNDIGHNTATNSVTAWMNSKSHHDALLDKKYNLVGFGISGHYVVQHFCELK